MSDNILPSQNPGLSNSPEPIDPPPEQPSVDGKSRSAESLRPPLPGETRLSPEEREWARRLLPSMEEMEREVRDLQVKGGFSFDDLEEIFESMRNDRDNA